MATSSEKKEEVEEGTVAVTTLPLPCCASEVVSVCSSGVSREALEACSAVAALATLPLPPSSLLRLS